MIHAYRHALRPCGSCDCGVSGNAHPTFKFEFLRLQLPTFGTPAFQTNKQALTSRDSVSTALLPLPLDISVLTASAVAKKKGGAVTSNSAHASRLRDPSLPARCRTFGKHNKPKPFSTTDPWDRDAHSQDTSNTLIPVTPLLDAARELRHSRHGGQQKYEELTAGLEKELKKRIDSRLIEAAVGLEKSGRQLDRHARLFLAVELAKYRVVFRGEGAADSKESKAFKNRIFDALFDTFPDLAPDNRVFKSEAAEVAYKEVSSEYC